LPILFRMYVHEFTKVQIANRILNTFYRYIERHKKL